MIYANFYRFIEKAMKKIKDYLKSPIFWIVLALVCYFSGAVLMERPSVEPLKEMGIAEQEEYYYEDSDGDEHEGQTLIDISGIGRILTYSDIYLASIPIFFIALLFGGLILNDGDVFRNPDEIKHVVYANCILGVLLIWLTTEGNIPSTVLFWLGIIAARHGERIDNPKSD